MALQGSGEIKITEIVAEFGGTVPHSLSEYYRNGGQVPGNNTGVSTSGEISMAMFYNAVNEIQITLSSSTTNYQLSNAFGSNWSTAVPKRLTINSGVTVGSSTTTAAMTIEGSMGGTLIVHNTGTIVGKGGAGSSSGAGGIGYNAVKADQNGNITFYNNSGGNIYGGGGGGGRGGNGGQGGKGGTGGRGGHGQYTQQTGTMDWTGNGNASNTNPGISCQGVQHVTFSGSVNQPFTRAKSQSNRHYFCQVCGGGHYFAQGGSANNARSRKGKVQFSGRTNCARTMQQTGANGGSGGNGGGGGNGGAGGNGAGYQQSLQAGSSGANGSGGQAGSNGGSNGNGSGQGGKGGTGGTGGKGGTGGTGGNYGLQGSQGATGNTGSTGATGNSGSNGNRTNGVGGSGGQSGSGGAGGSGGGAAGYYIQNRHYMTFHNSGTVAGQ